jgi:cobalamin biosynthesis protein CobD/CbiB
MTPFDVVAACALDAALGDPRRMPHPVRGMGRIITAGCP